MSGEANAYPVLSSEDNRLRAVSTYGPMATPSDGEFSRLADLAARLFNVPIALVSLVGRDRQFFKATVGIAICETAREHSFCTHTIAGGGVMVVQDARLDQRFAANPFVVGEPFVRFYAGAPLVSPTGHNIGTVCIIDNSQRPAFTSNDRKNLEDIAALVMQQMELHRLGQERKASEAKVLESERVFRLLVQGVTDYAIYMLDPNGIVTNWNLGAQNIKGYSPDEIIGRHFSRFYTSGDRQAGLPAKALATAAAEERFVGEGWRVRKDGSRFWASVVIDAIRDEIGTPIGFAKITRDVTERRRNEERLHRLAHVDTLTGLPNRVVLQTRLEKLVEERTPVSVFLLDLDGFKGINATLGHEAGDAIVKMAAARLQASMADQHFLARLEADKFGVLAPGMRDLPPIEAMGRYLQQLFVTPFTWEDQELHIAASIGISIEGGEGTPVAELVANAELALYRARAEGYGYKVFEPAFRLRAVARRELERELRRAVAQDELELFYQPQVALPDRRILGAEALLRWRHPERGLLSPAAFLQILESGPLAVPVGDWAIRSACAFAAAARRDGASSFQVGVNLFGEQLKAGRLVSVVREALADNQLPASALELEITENILLHQDETQLAMLQELRAMGVAIAFDDYGTGYASLTHLKQVPLTRLKIDQSFVRNLCTAEEDAAVVKAILYLGKCYGLDVIAEGIETEAQERALAGHGCGAGQGYLFGRPVPAGELLAKLPGGQEAQTDGRRLQARSA